MELLPIIYNSLIIAAGLFVITLAISYVSFKIKRNRKDEEPSTTVHTQKNISHDHDRSELKPKFKSPPPVKKQDAKIDKPIKKEEKRKEVEKPKTSNKSHHPIEKKKEKNTRIEVVTDLSKSSTKETERPKPKPSEKPKSDDQKLKKRLKSIDEDPIKKYTDSSDDDLHPLKTEE